MTIKPPLAWPSCFFVRSFHCFHLGAGLFLHGLAQQFFHLGEQLGFFFDRVLQQ